MNNHIYDLPGWVCRMLILCPVQGDADFGSWPQAWNYLPNLSDRSHGPPSQVIDRFLVRMRGVENVMTWAWGGLGKGYMCIYIHILQYVYIYIKEDIMMTYWKMMEHGDIASSPVDINGDNWDNQLINTSWVCIWTCGIYSPWWPLKSDNDDPS